MGNYEKISGASNAVIAICTFIGVGGAIAYYFFNILTQSRKILLLTLIIYTLAIYWFTKSITKKLRWT